MTHITFINDSDGTQQEVEVNLADAPFDDHGKPASLLAIALKYGIDIDHSCGGVCACSTCHIIIEEGGDQITPASDAEEDMLDLAPGLTRRSRLACQAEPLKPDGRYVVRIPAFNRNQVSEHG